VRSLCQLNKVGPNMKAKTVIAILLLVLVQCASSILGAPASNKDCYTRKTTNGRCCVFPFSFMGKKYYDCIALFNGSEWCSLTKNYDKEQQFGLCDKEVPVFDKIMNINDNDKIAKARIGDGVELFEGDIELSRELKADLIKKGIINGPKRKGRAVMRNRIGRWIGANGRPEVPYRIERSNAHAKGVIQRAIRHWESKVPCIRFVPYRGGQRIKYLSFFAGGGCYSMVGRQRGSGPQRISIGRGCEHLGVVAHEIGHALGFWHEQSRPDRDRYVVIHWANIRRGTEHNFKKYSTSLINSMNVPYDYMSLMHYGSKAFSTNGRYTITRRGGGTNLGQRYGLSPRDVQQARLLYCGKAPRPTNPPTRPPSGCRFTDKHRWCPFWQKSGYCNNRLYMNYMKNNCEKSCKCPIPCRDKFTNRLCSSWKNKGHCRRYLYVRTYCRKTCGAC